MEKIEAVIKRMRWKALFFEQHDADNHSKNFFGLKSDKNPPPIKELESFEKDCSNWYIKSSSNESTVNSKKSLMQI